MEGLLVYGGLNCPLAPWQTFPAGLTEAAHTGPEKSVTTRLGVGADFGKEELNEAARQRWRSTSHDTALRGAGRALSLLPLSPRQRESWSQWLRPLVAFKHLRLWTRHSFLITVAVRIGTDGNSGIEPLPSNAHGIAAPFTTCFE